MKSFYEERKYLSNEFTEAVYDESTGPSAEEVEKALRKYTVDNYSRPLPLVIAETFRYVLRNARIAMNEHGLFPDQIDLGCSYEPEQHLSHLGRIAVERCDKYIDRRFSPDVWRRRTAATRCGISNPSFDVFHCFPDWEDAIRLGFAGLLARAEERREEFVRQGELDKEKEIFFDSVKIVYESACEYLRRLADYAERKGLSDFAAEYRFLSENPPSTFYQVLLFSNLFLRLGELGFEHYRTYGRVDRLYYPFYKADLDAGRLTAEGAKEMLRFFLERISAAHRSADQPICLGGLNPDGSYTDNDLTRFFLEVYRELGNHNPKIHLRCHEKMPQELLDTVLSMIREGHSSICMISDETAVAAYARIGIGREEALTYCPTGCYELVIPHKEDPRICSGWINLAKPIDFMMSGEYTDAEMLMNLPRTDSEPESFDAFLCEYFRVLDAAIEFTCKSVRELCRYTFRCNPSPFLSGSFDCCLKKGKDFFDGGMEYRNNSLKIFAVGTAVDSLLAIKKLVYEEKVLTLPRFREILRRNWEGEEKLRLRILSDREKWGNGLPGPDSLAKELYDFCASRIIGRRNGVGGVFRMGADSVAMSEDLGRATGATPDGRFAGEPLTKNFRPGNGLEREGITAFIQSVTKIDGSYFVDGSPLDFLIHPSAVEGEEGLEVFRSLVQTYFKKGGFAIQGNIFSVDTLRKAQVDPSSYRNLQVRVCGWNEYFVNMKKSMQDSFIARAEGIENAK